MYKKIGLIITIFIMIYLSNVPHIQVSKPETWINSFQYEQNIAWKSFIEKESYFYLPYSDLIHKEFILHKIAHITFYSLLTCLIYINLNIKKQKYAISWFITTLFAVTDEIHQYFIVGRSGRALDIALDSTASLVTVFMIWLAYKRKVKKEQKIKIDA